MKYKCKSLPLTKMVPTPKGFLTPLCNECQTLDCENDVELKKISIVGITMEAKLLAKRDEPHSVISCEGYIHAKRK